MRTICMVTCIPAERPPNELRWRGCSLKMTGTGIRIPSASRASSLRGTPSPKMIAVCEEGGRGGALQCGFSSPLMTMGESTRLDIVSHGKTREFVLY